MSSCGFDGLEEAEFNRKERKEKDVDNISPRMRIWSMKTPMTSSSSGGVNMS